MGFKELLDAKLGPMRDLVVRPTHAATAPVDPALLWYRRAAGLELRMRPEESWNEVEVGPADRPRDLRKMLWSRAAPLIALTQWSQAGATGLDPKSLWSAVEQDLLYYAHQEPKVALTGRAGVLQLADEATRIRRRASMWPTAAVATAIQVAPMPFMPRGRDLAEAELVGLRLASLERGHEVFGATITGTRRTGRVLRALWPLLDGRHTLSEILSQFERGGARAEAKKLLFLLDALTALEPAAPLPQSALRMAAPIAPQVTWLGHAGALLQAGGTNVLVDPLFNSISEPEAAWSWPPKFDARTLPPVHGVFISHGDNDHLNPNSLVQLPRDIPIFVPRTAAYPPPHQVDIRGVLKVLGFNDVREWVAGDVIDLGGLTVTAYPFEGEDWGLEMAQLTYLVEAPGLSVYLSADAGAMPHVYDALGARGRQIDLALLGVSGAAEPMVSPSDLGYGNFYADWVPKVRHNEWVQHCAGPDEAAAAAARFKPRFAFGYACGGASYVPMAYCDRGDHDALADRLLAGAGATQPVALPLGEPVTKADLEQLPTHSPAASWCGTPHGER